MNIDDTFNEWAAITKSDIVNFDGSTYSATAAVKAVPALSVYAGGAGIVVAVSESGSAVNFTVTAGQVLPVKCIRVNSTSTTATLMVALYRV